MGLYSQKSCENTVHARSSDPWIVLVARPNDQLVLSLTPRGWTSVEERGAVRDEVRDSWSSKPEEETQLCI